MKIRLMGAELFQADGQTDGRTDKMKLTATLRNFANSPEETKRLYFVTQIM